MSRPEEPRGRVIVHVDMDAFYASVEQKDDPSLAGRPVIVGADPRGGRGRGVVAAASYEARAFGVRSAQPISTAFRKCPDGVFLEPRFDRYMEVSGAVMTVFHAFTPLVEPAGLDEAFLDMTGTERLWGDPSSAGRRIKQEVRSAAGLTASVGVGPSKSVAKIASDLRKPDGLVVVPSAGVLDFLGPLPVSRFSGVGPKSAERLAALGIRVVADVRRFTRRDIASALGGFGEWLWEQAQGLDVSPVVPEREARSVSNETTFDEDTDDADTVRAVILGLSERVGFRLRRMRARALGVELKVRFEDFFTRTRSLTLPEPADLSEIIFHSALALYEPFSKDGRKIRLLGVGVTRLGFQESLQTELFESGRSNKRMAMHEAVDSLKSKYGLDIVSRASES